MKNRFISKKTKFKDSKTVIEFSQHTIKLAQASFKNKPLITHLACQDNIADSEDGLVEALTKIIKTNHLVLDNPIITLDRSLVSLRFIKLPSVNEQEISDMAKWQAAKLLPYKIDEIEVAHQTLRSTDDGFSYVLLIIVPKNIVKKFTDIFEAVKLQPQSITISSEGLLDWYIQRHSQSSLNETVALIDIDSTRFELVVLYKDKFIFSRSFALAKIDTEIQMKKKIIEEIRLSVDSYRKQEIYQPINKMVITGTKNQISDLAQLFSHEFDFAISVIDHLENIDLEKDVLETAFKKDISFSSICAIALAQKSVRINLLPQEIKDRTLYLGKKRQLFKTVYLAIFAVLVSLSLLGFNFYTKRKIIESLDNELNKINPTAKQIQDIKNKMSIINAQLDDENSCIEILREIHKITPQNLYLSTFIFEEDKGVTLKGMAPSMSLVFSFVPILNKSPFFKDVQVRYATQRKTQDGEMTDFEIICPLKSRVKEK